MSLARARRGNGGKLNLPSLHRPPRPLARALSPPEGKTLAYTRIELTSAKSGKLLAFGAPSLSLLFSLFPASSCARKTEAFQP